MNNKLVLGVVIFICFLFASIVIVYYMYEKPTQHQLIVSQNNLSIKFIDAESKNQIEANYAIVIDGEVYKTGKSLSEGFILERVPVNKSIYIYSINGSQKYYNTQYIYTSPQSAESQNIKADIEITPVGKLFVNQSDDIHSNKVLTLSSNGTIKSMVICITWSDNIITANLANYTRMTIPDFVVSKVNKCYDTKEFLKTSSKSFQFDYKLLDAWNDDYIKVFVFDRDITIESIKNCPNNCYNIRDDNGNDVGIQDVIFEMK